MDQREIEAFTLHDTALALVEARGANIAPDMRVFETGALRVEYSSGNPKNLDIFFTGQRTLCMVWSDTTACINHVPIERLDRRPPTRRGGTVSEQQLRREILALSGSPVWEIALRE
jgi:hypothetical protein